MMNSSTSMDYSKSSLVGLKAELLKKQEEVKKLKELGVVQKERIKQSSFKNKKNKNQKLSGISEKSTSPSHEFVEDDFDTLRKSREVLEAKAKLYDRLKANSSSVEDAKSYLIDFELKEKLTQHDEKINNVEESNTPSEDEENYDSDPNSDPENDWVDFVDTLGRSRRCLRKDLPSMEERDTKLATSLRPPSPTPTTVPEPTPELLSWDMQREVMRKKWEEQETLLLGKKDIHYQDILFDEARPHGVGYFEFSVDEAERQRQQEALRRLRSETEEQQAAAAGLRARRQQQLAGRMAAARRRRRERLGLPPDEPPTEEEGSVLEVKEEPPKEENIEELKESIKKIAPVRPWDIGKDGVNPVMSQEEWVEKKRQERPAEFAPVVNLEERNDAELEESKPRHNFFTTKKNKNKLRNKTEHLFKTPQQAGKSRPSIVETYEATFSRPMSKDDQNYEVKEKDDEEWIGPTVADMTGGQPLSKAHLAAANLHVEDNPKTNVWKPTLNDIDDFLTKSRETCFSASSEEGEKHLSSSYADLSCIPLPKTNSVNPENRPSLPKISRFISNSNKPGTIINTDHVQCDRYENKPGTIINTDHVQCDRYENNQTDGSNATDSCYNDNTFLRKNSTCISVIHNEVDLDDSFEQLSNHAGKVEKQNTSKRKWAEIAPPSSMSYYIHENTGSRAAINPRVKKEQLLDSISAGMSFLKAKTNEKQSKRVKGLLDIV